MAKGAAFGYSTSSLFYFALIVFIAAIGIVIVMRKMREGFSGSGGTVTLYFMTNCSHCKAFKDEWEKFKLVAAEQGKVSTDEKEAKKDNAAVTAAGVTGFPTIRFTNAKGDSSDYNGDRTAIALSMWVDEQLRKSA
jgi:glutaredoxin